MSTFLADISQRINSFILFYLLILFLCFIMNENIISIWLDKMLDVFPLWEVYRLQKWVKPWLMKLEIAERWINGLTPVEWYIDEIWWKRNILWGYSINQLFELGLVCTMKPMWWSHR